MINAWKNSNYSYEEMTTTANYRSTFAGLTTNADNDGTDLMVNLTSDEIGIPWECNIFERNWNAANTTQPQYGGADTNSKISASNAQFLANRLSRVLHDNTFLGANFTKEKVKRLVITVEMDGSA